MNRWLIACLCCSFIVSTAYAAKMPSPDEDWMKKSQELLEQSIEEGAPEWVQPDIPDDYLDIANDLNQQANRIREQSQNHAQPKPVDRGDVIRVFLTLGDGDEHSLARFKQQLESLSGMDDVVVQIRGIPKSMRRIDQLMVLLHDMGEDIEDAPPVDLDPAHFHDMGDIGAPTVAFFRNDKPIAYLSGSLEVNWLKDKVAAGERGNLGRRGETIAIAEPFLMETIRQRWAEIDWEAKKDKAIANYWKSYRPPVLETVKAYAEHTMDPSVVAAQTMKTPDGRVIVHKGDRINPLESVPFTGRLIAFDGTDKDQIKVAKGLIERTREEGLRPIVLTAGLPDEPSFKTMEDLQTTVGDHVYLLDDVLIARFNIRRLPSTVSAEDLQFVIKELPPKETLASWEADKEVP